MTRKRSSPTLPRPDDPNEAKALSWALLALMVAILSYAALFLKYRIEDLDDAWSLSYIHQFWRFGIEEDPIFGGPSRMAHFGKIHAFVTAPLLDLLGWTRGTAHALSLLWITLAASLWSLTLLRLGASRSLALGFFATTLLLEPFLGTAYSARSDAFAYLLCSISLFAFVRGNVFFAVLAAGIAFETHPMGIMACVYLASVCVHEKVRERLRNVDRRFLFSLASAVVLSALIYVCLHIQSLTNLSRELKEGHSVGGRAVNNYLFDYFFKTKRMRHLPELFLFLAATLLFLRRRLWRSDPFPAALLVLTLLSSIALGRPNYHYALYAFPAFLLVTLVVARSMGRVWLALAFLVLLVTPQYTFLYVQNRSFDWEGQLRVLRAQVPDDGHPVLGSAKEWFAFKDRTFRWSQYVGERARLDFESAHLVEEDDYRTSPGSLKPWVEANFRSTPAGAVTLFGETYRFVELRREAPEGKPKP